MFPYDKSDVKSEVEGNGCSCGRMVVVHRRLQMAGRRCRTVVGGEEGRKEGEKFLTSARGSFRGKSNSTSSSVYVTRCKRRSGK